jgi:4-amino-4-deoxy-L-arabinose transferase-like glycosyltransferase
LRNIKAPIIQEFQNRPFPNLTAKTSNFRRIICEYYPLLSVLLAYLLIALSVGPYENGDTAWELDSVSGVLKYGLPYSNGSHLIDQPPLGFFVQAVFAKTVGLSINNGTFLVTLFGFGCIVLIYEIGKAAYNKTTGFFAGLLFALSPWHMVISRSFLIDVPCLFFSLLSVFLGLIAVQKSSLKFFIFSGLAFAAAFNTKLYAVFALIPLLALFLRYNPKEQRKRLLWLGAFSIPVLVTTFFWYETIAAIGISSIFLHPDFFIPIPTDVTATYFFATNFLVSYGLGWFLIDAAVFSLLVYILQRHLLRNFLFFDAVSVAVIACVLAVNIFLGAGLHLRAPFQNAFKYDYQTLPFFCFLAGSLVSKSVSIITISWSKKRWLLAGGLFGFILVAATLVYNVRYIQFFSMWEYLIFRVAPNINAGYSLFNASPLVENSPLLLVQFIGIAMALTGILWIGRQKILALVAFLRRR